MCDIERLCVILNDNIMTTNYVLKMYICKDDTTTTSEQLDTMKEWYLNAILKHNKHIEESVYPDAGFDLFVPNDYFVHDVTGTSTVPLVKVNMKVVCAMYKQVYCRGGDDGGDVLEVPVGYTMYPRSSLSKTPLRMANSVGVIDSGYRGPLLGAFDVLGNLNTMGLDELLVEEKQRLVQVCHPGLEPFRVVLVDRLDDLGTTCRGKGGFGSTGK